MLLVTEGLLIAVLGTHLVLLGFVVWCLRRAALHIKCARRLVIGEMDCDELIDKLMSVADPQDAGTGLAEGAPPAAAPAAMPEEKEQVQKHRERLAAIAVGGQAEQYALVVLGENICPSVCQHLCRTSTFMSKLVFRSTTRLNNHQTLHETSP